jgi:hypothetical protein
MKVELEIEETRELLTLIVERLASEADLAKEDLAKLRRWNSGDMRLSAAGMRELHEKVNAEIARTFRNKAKSAVRKPDWK